MVIVPGLLAPFIFCGLLEAGVPIQHAAVTAVLLSAIQLSLTWKTSVAAAMAAVLGHEAGNLPLLSIGAKMLRDTARSRLGILAYDSPLGGMWHFADEAPLLEPLPNMLPQHLTVVRTSQSVGGGERHKVLLPLPLQDHIAPQKSVHIIVDPSHRYQTFLGFGGSFTESSAELLLQMSPECQEIVLKAYFSKEQGLGYNWGRVHMGACDFSRGDWSCAEEAGDTKLRSFTIERYRTAMLPMIRRAEKVADQKLHLLASPWSPPAWMKDTKRMRSGGRLLKEFWPVWALHYVRFAQAFQDEGVPLWGFTVQNEPHAITRWENCLYSAEEERDFVRDHLGPALEASGLDLKVLAWDHNRDDMFARAHTIYSDPEAAKHVWGLGYHWYGDPRYESWPPREGMVLHENVRKVHEFWPDKHIIMTEACQENGPRIGDWKLGERYADAIIKDLEGWLEAWIDWNLILDERGGPNHVNNLVSAPIIYDTGRKRLLFLSSYYYIGHFSRFIKPGAQRVAAASNRDQLQVTSFENPDGSIITVVLNQGKHRIPFWLQVGTRSVETEAPARSISTYILPSTG